MLQARRVAPADGQGPQGDSNDFRVINNTISTNLKHLAADWTATSDREMELAMNFDTTTEYVDDQAAISFSNSLAMELSMHACALPKRACCAGAGEDNDALARAMHRPRRTRRVA